MTLNGVHQATSNVQWHCHSVSFRYIVLDTGTFRFVVPHFIAFEWQVTAMCLNNPVSAVPCQSLSQ